MPHSCKTLVILQILFSFIWKFPSYAKSNHSSKCQCCCSCVQSESLLFTRNLLFCFYYCASWEKSFLQSITVETFHCVMWEHNFLCAISIMFFCRKEDVKSLSSALFLQVALHKARFLWVLLDIVVRM